MNKIPFLNFPPDMKWGTKYQKIATYCKSRGYLKSEQNDIIEIADSWNNIEFRAWLEFSKFFRKLNRIVLGIPKKDSYQNQTVDDFINIHDLLVGSLGEPKFKKGISFDKLKQTANIQLLEIDTLPYFEWEINSTRLILNYFDHWGIGFEITMSAM